MAKDKFVPKPLELDSPAGERQSRFLDWIQTYEGLEDPVGLEGLDQLHGFIEEQLPYVADGRGSHIRIVTRTIGGRRVFDYAYIELNLISHDESDNWGRVKYFCNKLWVRAAFNPAESERLQAATSNEEIAGLDFDPLLHVEVPREEMARIPIGVLLYALATVFTVKAYGAMCHTYLDEVRNGWRHQSHLLRTAHAFENALLMLRAKSQQIGASQSGGPSIVLHVGRTTPDSTPGARDDDLEYTD
ncbi:MAG: hypothetical protein NT039_02965 [Candidatus Berkelbacteria bacterium]|nr:hypothetical protein [Candidatus Berkelbacteria bacterium]